MKKFILFTPLLFIFIHCQHFDSQSIKVKKSLELSKKNKDELIYVLDNFKKDSLKYKAACYLIEEMPGHISKLKSTTKPNVVLQSFFSMDSIIRKESLYQRKNFENISESTQKQFSYIRDNLLKNNIYIEQQRQDLEDVKNINGKWLITHIDNAFNVWKSSPLTKNMTFDEFKETLLPYRYNNETLEYSNEEYKKLVFSIVTLNSLTTIEEIVDKLNAYTTTMSCMHKSDNCFGDLGIYNPIQFNNLGCDKHSEWYFHALNALGVPAVSDFTPSWLNRSRRHYWIAIKDSLGRYHPFTPMWQSLNDTTYFNETSKVFRRTFKKQITPYTRKYKNEEIPDVFNSPFMIDVSDQYHKVTNLKIPFSSMAKSNNFAYLSIFSNKGWQAVAWGEKSSSKTYFEFKKIPLFVLYVPGIYSNSRIKTDGYPFYLNGKGKPEPIIINKKKLITLKLTRKFHEKGHLIDKMIEMVGTKIQGANKTNFSDAEDLYTLRIADMSSMSLKHLKINSKKKYRYIRCIPKNKKGLNIATFEIYSNKKRASELIRITANPLSDTSNYSLAFDSDLGTFITPKSMELDLLTPTLISQIYFAPRNSNNGVIEGDNYELLYFDKEWISSGRVKASANLIIFKNVPSNTIYWLKNLDHGTEEQAFLYNNQKQIFINEDNYVDNKWIPFRNLASSSLLSNN